MLTPFEAAGSETWTSIAAGETFASQLAASSPRVQLLNLGTSVEGRVMRGIAVGHPTPNLTGTTALLVASQHGNEPASREAAFALARDLAEANTTDMQEYLRRVTWVIMPTCNPDNNAITRLNADGVNINSEYPHPTHPEGQAIMRACVMFKPTLIIDSHEGGISFDEDLATQGASAEVIPLPIRQLSDQAADAVEAGMQAAGRSSTRFSGGSGTHILRNAGGVQNACTVLLESFQSKNNDVQKPGRAISIRTSDQRIAYNALIQHHRVNLNQYISVHKAASHPGGLPGPDVDRVLFRTGGQVHEVERILYRSGGQTTTVYKARG